MQEHDLIDLQSSSFLDSIGYLTLCGADLFKFK